MTTIGRKEARKLWVEALRSGEYRQAKGALGMNDGGVKAYCCLGVACEVYLDCGGVLKVSTEDGNVLYNRHDAVLPEEVQCWLGLAFADGTYERIRTLADDNDNDVSFDKIADLIESEPSGLFEEEPA